MGKSMISMAIFNSYAILPERLDHGSGCSPPRRPAPWEPRRERPPVVKGTLPSRARAPQSPPGSPQPDEGKDLDGPGHREKGPVRTKLSKPTKMWIWQWKTHQKFIRNGNFTNKEWGFHQPRKHVANLEHIPQICHFGDQTWPGKSPLFRDHFVCVCVRARVYVCVYQTVTFQVAVCVYIYNKYVYIYICIYIYTHTYTYAYTYICTYTYAYTYTYTYTLSYTYTCTHIHIYIHIYIHIHINIYTCSCATGGSRLGHGRPLPTSGSSAGKASEVETPLELEVFLVDFPIWEFPNSKMVDVRENPNLEMDDDWR